MTTEAAESTMVRAAKIRAQLVKYFNSHNDQKRVADVYAELRPEWDKLGAKKDAIAYQLTQLASNKLIKLASQTGLANYYSNNGVKAPHPDEPQQVRRAAPDVEPEVLRPNEQQSHVKLEIVKKSGVVRLGVHGLVIEIGVSER